MTYEQCPACQMRLPADDLMAQRAHITAAHPELVEQRLRSAGFRRDDDGEWIDCWAE